jgi:hypothetical protein
LESKLNDFYYILPRLDRRRTLVNFGDNVLKALFVTATTSDIHLLHEVLNELQFQNSNISHSLANQFTYVKKLNTAVKIDTEAVANLSSIIKEIMVQSHERYQQVVRDILWLNITFFGQSEMHTVNRQLKFTLFQLVLQIDDLFNVVQCAMHGLLSIKLVNPIVLQNILRNVTLGLPEGYELIAGTDIEIIHLYYDLTAVSVLANTYSSTPRKYMDFSLSNTAPDFTEMPRHPRPDTPHDSVIRNWNTPQHFCMPHHFGWDYDISRVAWHIALC